MFGGEIVLAAHLNFCRKPCGYNATSLKDWSGINAGVVIFKLELFFKELSSCHGNGVLAMGKWVIHRIGVGKVVLVHLGGS